MSNDVMNENSKYKPVTAEEFLEAERKAVAGVVARLLTGFREKYDDLAGSYAMAVANVLFSLPPANENDEKFLLENQATVLEEIKNLKEAKDIREIVTQTIAVRFVFSARENGCDKKDPMCAFKAIQDMGIFIQNSPAPSPKSYLLSAEKFLQSAPRK